MKTFREDIFSESSRILGVVNCDFSQVQAELALAGVRERKKRLGWTDKEEAEFIEMLGIREVEREGEE